MAEEVFFPEIGVDCERAGMGMWKWGFGWRDDRCELMEGGGMKGRFKAD